MMGLDPRISSRMDEIGRRLTSASSRRDDPKFQLLRDDLKRITSLIDEINDLISPKEKDD